EGSMEHVVCVTSSRLNVRDESLSRVLFSVARHETVKPVQSWETNKKTKVIDGETYTFVKVQFPQRPSDSNIGWVAEMYVTPKSKCPGVPSDGDGPVQPSGWTFPTIARPTHSYRTGMRRFQASRGGGTRWHAASDLYRVKNESAVAVSAGQVLRGLYFFYQGTYAIEVRHTGGKVVRYGEITGRAASGVSEGRNVSRGQVVGYIGQVNSNCCLPMLHFEMYSGTASGPLTQGGNKFQRRRDLLDPTGDLMKWEKEKFGVSH
ncbi:MAG: M23 family metallopeptidase, partial [Bdellovibrionales bacterium]